MENRRQTHHPGKGLSDFMEQFGRRGLRGSLFGNARRETRCGAIERKGIVQRQHGDTDGAQTGQQVPGNMPGTAVVLQVIAAIGGGHVSTASTVVVGVRRLLHLMRGCRASPHAVGMW